MPGNRPRRNARALIRFQLIALRARLHRYQSGAPGHFVFDPIAAWSARVAWGQVLLNHTFEPNLLQCLNSSVSFSGASNLDQLCGLRLIHHMHAPFGLPSCTTTLWRMRRTWCPVAPFKYCYVRS